MSKITTMKIEKVVRDDFMSKAKAEGHTATTFLSELLEEHEEKQMLTAVQEAYARLSDTELKELNAEIAEWDDTLADGLEDYA